MNQKPFLRANNPVLLITILSILLCSGCTENQKETLPEKPNIILIFIDDLGWPAISSYGNEHVETINIDRIAKEGMKFTDAYVTPQCTPSRASLITGQHTARNGMWHVIYGYYYPYARSEEPQFRINLPHETYTMAEALKDNGYKTAMIGKWHLTQNNDGYYTRMFPRAKEHYGFDYVDPMTDPSEYHKSEDKGVDYLTNLAIDFIEENKDTNFFVYLSHHTIHGKVMAPENLVQKYLDKGYPEEGKFNATYLAAIEHMDVATGRLLDKLDELEIAGKTVVMFLSDNGGVDAEFDNEPLRWGKGAAYEGGIRVPFLVRWPGVIEEGSVTEIPVHINDMYPTFLDIAGGEMKEDHVIDGKSIVPLMKQEYDSWERNTLYWYMPLYDIQWGASPAAIIRKDKYKLISFFHDYIEKENNFNYIPIGRIELYDLENDLGETNNLVDSLPELAKEMEKKLYTWIYEMGAELPGLNENYNRDSVYVVHRPKSPPIDFPEVK